MLASIVELVPVLLVEDAMLVQVMDEPLGGNDFVVTVADVEFVSVMLLSSCWSQSCLPQASYLVLVPGPFTCQIIRRARRCHRSRIRACRGYRRIGRCGACRQRRSHQGKNEPSGLAWFRRARLCGVVRHRVPRGSVALLSGLGVGN